MNDRQWLERLEDELGRGALPRRVRGRLLAELRDHITDLMEEAGMEAIETRLGTPEGVAEAAAIEYQRTRGWRRRLSAAALVVGPVPVAAVLMYLYVLTLVGIGWACGLAEEVNGLSACATLTPTQRWLIRAAHQSLKYVPFALAAAGFAWLARRSGRGWAWAGAACLMVALAAGEFDTRLRLPVVPGTGYVMADFMLGTVPRWSQAVVPLVAGAAVFAWWRRPMWEMV